MPVITFPVELVNQVETPDPGISLVAGRTVLLITPMVSVVIVFRFEDALVLGVVRVGNAELQGVIVAEIRGHPGKGGPEARTVARLVEPVLALFFAIQGDAQALLVPLGQFHPEQGVKRGFRQPGELQAGILQAVIPKQVQVGQVLVGEIPLMGMLAVDVSEIAQELAALHLEPVGQVTGLEPGFFQIHVTVAVHDDVGGGVEVGIHGGGEDELGLAEIETVAGLAVTVSLVTFFLVTVAGPGLVCLAHQRRTLTPEAVVVIVAVENHGHLRVEGAARGQGLAAGYRPPLVDGRHSSGRQGRVDSGDRGGLRGGCPGL